MAKDPVCGKEIDEAAARAQTGHTMHGASEVDPKRGTRQFHDGKWYYFCSLDCRSKFMSAPQGYLQRGSG
jgi:YHS domain-containing protein